MAYIRTSDSIVINATLTEKGKKLLARGKFRVSKFALGDDEIDYDLFDPERFLEGGYNPALVNSYMLEAYKKDNANIFYGLDSHESAILYLTQQEVDASEVLHANIEYLPILKQNSHTNVSPTLSSSVYYLSANQETTEKLESIGGFRFLTTDKLENVKIVIESGIDNPNGSEDITRPTKKKQAEYIFENFLLDMDYYVYADNRFINKVCGIKPNSEYRNYAYSAIETDINFVTADPSPPVSLSSEYENYATYLIKGIINKMYSHLNYDTFAASWDATDSAQALKYGASILNGPRGGIVALNPILSEELKENSTGTRDFRYSDYGFTEKILFSELPTSKFDYIDTTIYVMGLSSNARIQIPIRIVRYAGT